MEMSRWGVKTILELVETDEMGMARFVHVDSEDWPYDGGMILRIPEQMWKDLESPQQITVTLEAGDTLEDATDTSTGQKPVNEIDNG